MKKIVCLFIASLLHVSIALASTYNLRVEVTPHGAGTLNANGGNYEESSSLYLRTYSNTGFVFKGWYEGDSLLSLSTSFYYTMPAYDVTVQARYEYNPSVPGNPAMPDTTTYYAFTATISPKGAGSLNLYSGKYAAGQSVSLRAYTNTGYYFSAWKNEYGETLSTSSSYTYTMPNQDTHLVAAYTYNPSVPANPDTVVPKYTVSVSCEPLGGGTFNTSYTTVEKGGNVRLYAYANTGFVFQYWKNEAGDTISTAQNFYYTIPEQDSKVIGVFRYNPAPPSNPNKNYWNPETGEVIADDFSAGSLYSAITQAINGSSRSDVSMITVVGRINNNDFGIANNFSNCTLLDLSRVTGVTEVPTYAFDGTNLETIYLPSTIEHIGSYAFDGCSLLSSITCYATTPPTLGSYVFRNIPAGLVVYVPASVIPQYQEADGWKNFTILPIQNDIRSITVNLPDNVNASDFKQMWLELTNVKSGQRLHYIMTERSIYTFYNLIHHTTWNIQLRNEAGDVFGKIENVEVADNDTSVTFTSLQKPQSVTLSVRTPEGVDVTNKVTITWTNSDGVYQAKSSFLNMQIAGKPLNYSIQLPQDLAMQYVLPQPAEYVVKSDSNSIVHTLDSLSSVVIVGKTIDKQNNRAINNASIIASLTYAGKYTQTIETKTNKEGLYQINIPKVATVLSFASNGYVSQTINCDSIVLNATDTIRLDDIALKSISGTVLNLNYKYISCPNVNGDVETQNWYNDYNNVQYTLYNITKQRTITQFNVQYPQIVLLEEVEDNDQLQITATSKNNAFMPVDTLVTIQGQKANVTFDIYELGQIQASYDNSTNQQVVGILYAENGELTKSYTYNDTQLAIKNLTDGIYTLISMGYNPMLNGMYHLEQYAEIGLIEGNDYVKHTVEVKSGIIATVSIATVPQLDESKFNYTGENTSFTVNKPSIVAGNYLTLTGKINFKTEFANKVSNVHLVVDLPESCSFVENSVMVGNSISSYVLNGNRLSIPMTRHTDRVRFCVIPTRGGKYAPSASVQFDINQETITQPIGAANYEVKDLSITVPSVVAKTTVPVTGTAIGKSKVEIFDNDTKIGETTALANGVWSITCELNEPYNLSTHSIYAKVTTPQGLDLQSETMECIYDKNAVQVSKVIMYHPNPELNKTFESVFDFINPSSKPNKWTVYYPKKVFTYTIEFTNNSPEVVSNVILYVHTADGKYLPYDATYNEEKDLWFVECDLGTKNDGCYPVNVSVDFDALVYGPISRKSLEAAEFDYVTHSMAQTQIELSFDKLDSLFFLGTLTEEEFDSLLSTLSHTILDTDTFYMSEDSVAEILLQSDLSLLESENILNDNKWKELCHMNKYGKFDLLNYGIQGTYEVKTAEEVTIEQLLERGFEKMVVDDSSDVYQLVLENSYEIVDFAKNTYTILLFDANNVSQMLPSRGFVDGIQKLKNAIEQYEAIMGEFAELRNKILDAIGSLPDIFEIRIDEIDYTIKKNRAIYKELQSRQGTMPTIEENLKISEQITKLKGKNIQLGKEKAELLESLNVTMKMIGKIMSCLAAFMDAYSTGCNASEYIDLWYSVPFCKCDSLKTVNLQNEILQAGLRCATKDLCNLSADIYTIHMIFSAITMAPVTAGASLVLGVSGVGLSIIKGYVNSWADNEFKKERSIFSSRINALAKDKSCWTCPDPDPVPNPNPNPNPNHEGGGEHKSGSEDDEVQIDPSGYVYEAVSSNRLEGVIATCYYKETVEDMYGDLHENIVKWNAEEYAQENPLFTDENGMYRWDVPQGLWQVKFEKEGYETTYSDWLPVPPPQLEVNIAMKQNVQPNVQAVRAYEDAIEIQFDKYMLPELLTTDNIIVMADTSIIAGSIQLMNEEIAYEGLTDKYVSHVRFNAADTFATEEITLLVKNRIKSYAGIRMQDDFTQSFTIQQEIKNIVSDSLITVIYGEEKNVNVQVLPASAAAGKKLHVKSSSPMLLQADTTIVLNQEGKAVITLSGELPGSASIQLTVEDSDISASSIVKIVDRSNFIVAMPVASIESGSTIQEGTTIALSCETENTMIYYTTDGSCPCDTTLSSVQYNGQPIVINRNTTLKAIAYADAYESEIATFYYTVLLSPVDTTICANESVLWNGVEYASTGVYIDTLNIGIATLNLVVLPEVPITEDYATICYGETYTWNGETYTESGEYVYTTTAANGCDSIVTLHLTINETQYAEESITACDSYAWNGETYTASGDYVYTTTAANGCDSIVTLHLTINQTQYAEETVTACDSYEWNGQTYATTGAYTYTTTATNGCDSIVTLHLTINQTQYAEEAVVACDSYAWNGETYTASGEYTYTTTATNGCDSIVTLHLTINKTQYAEEAVTACDSYTWNGETYTESGNYVYTTTAKNGCDSIVTLHLIINATQYAEETVTACDAYIWNGETYTESGEYTYNTTAANGCDSVVTLHLTINATKYAEETVTACDSYTWNGETYTESGEYVYTTTAANGCDSIVTLHLTINKSEREEYSAVACDEYIWNGVIYTESGDYTYTTTTAADCERVEVLHLTINKSEHVEFTETACDSYVWNGVTYTESGDYTYTTTTAAGCERVEVLHLTINKSEHIEETVTACDSYEWNGLVYTESGDYEFYTTTAAGCERIEVLHLTILPEATTESETLVLCPSELPYEWHGQSITEAGTYSATEQYAGMECDSIIHELTLNVYVQTLPVAVTLPIVRTGEAIDVTIPTAEIQAHIAADTWYAPDALIAWYILDNSNWATLTDEPVSSGINEVVMKYAVDSDCGSVESDRIIIPVETTGVENIPTDEIGVYKVVRDNQIFIIRGGNIYSIVGHIIKD